MGQGDLSGVTMEEHPFVDLLSKRRKDCDILWASRSMDIQFPHKLPEESKYTRKQIKEAVLNNPKIRQLIPVVATVQNVSRHELTKQINAMVDEMASKARLVTVRWLSMLLPILNSIISPKKCITIMAICVFFLSVGVIITKAMKRIFSSIYINEDVLLRLRKEMQMYQVQYVYAPSHRSYLDFILMSYILFSYDMALPNIASGMDFYQMFIVGELLRHTGAFFMRRTFSNDLLYKVVFRTYVSSILSHSGRAVEFFIEGTRSRNLKSIIPKYGLLSNILESVLEGSVPDVHFVPISISYERPPEELLFVYELLGVPKPKESTVALFRALSILKKPYGYGRVFFNIGKPVSACQFLDMVQRKTRVLSPYANLNSTLVEKLAYHLIEAHKQNTVLISINLIALLVNERSQTQPSHPYTLETLIQDYDWCKTILSTRFGAMTPSEKLRASCWNGNNCNSSKEDILSSLHTHEELLLLDTSNTLRIIERHGESKLQTKISVRGHTLSEETMRVAVPSINLYIYLNPILSFLLKPAIAVVAVGFNKIKIDKSFENYQLLWTMLSTEFAISFTIDETKAKREWEEVLQLLIKENCLRREGDTCTLGENKKLHSLLYNVMLPYIGAIYITCLVLFEWDEVKSSYPSNQGILTEAQKQAETAFLENKSWGKHPYSLSLDLYKSTLATLVTQGVITISEQRDSYRIDKIRLAKLIFELEELRIRWPPGSYLEIHMLPMKRTAKL